MHFRVPEFPQCRVWVARVGEREGRCVSDEGFALDLNRGSRQVKLSKEGTRVRRLAAERLTRESPSTRSPQPAHDIVAELTGGITVGRASPGGSW